MKSLLGFGSPLVAGCRGSLTWSPPCRVSYRTLSSSGSSGGKGGTPFRRVVVAVGSSSWSSSSLLWSSPSRFTLSSSGATPYCTPRRSFYEKAKGNEDDTKPNEFFASFGTKNPNAQAVPKELHKSNVQAVSDAEVLNRLFLLFVCVCLMGMLYYGWQAMYEHTGGRFQRPAGYGVCSAPDRLRSPPVKQENSNTEKQAK